MAGKADIELRIINGSLGATAEARDDNAATNSTLVDKTAPATVAGVITEIEIYAETAMSAVKVGTFHNISGNILSCRDWKSIGAIAAGSKQTVSTDSDGNPLAIQVDVGDYLGIYGTDGAIELDASAGDHFWRSPTTEDLMGCSNKTFSLVSNAVISLYATISYRYGFRLASDKAGQLAWEVQQAPVLRPGQARGPVSYADVPPEQELIWAENYSAHGGFGQLDFLDPTRYFSADGVDARFRGKVFCGPLLRMADLEPALGGSGLDGPVYCAAEHEKSYLIGAGRAIYQNGKPYSLTSTGSITMTIHETNKTITISGSTWDTEALEAGRTFTVSGSGASNDGLYTVASVSTTVITAEEDFAAEVGDDDPELTISTDFWRLVLDSGDDGIDILSLVSHRGYAYAALKKTGGSSYQLSDTGNEGDWAGGSGGTTDYDFFCSLHAYLWGFRGRELANIAAVTPVTTGTHFDSSYTVGDSSYDFTWVINHHDILVIGKRDGLYSIDRFGDDKHLIPELRAMSHDLNFRRMVSWRGKVFMPLGVGGLWAWPGVPYEDLSPRKFGPHNDNFHGLIGGLAWDTNWLFAVARGGVSGSYYTVGLLAGAYVEDEMGTRWVWHPLATWTDDDAHFLIIFRAPTTNQPRMWLFRGVSAATDYDDDYQPSFIDLPRPSDNPLEATDDKDTDYAYRFASGGNLVTSWWDKGLPGMTVACASLTVKGSNLANVTGGDQRYIEVDYQIDDADASWVLAATSGFTLEADAEDDGVTKEEDFYFPTNTTGKRFRLRYKFYTTVASGDPEETPVLELPTILRVIPRPESRKRVAFAVQCADGLADGLSAAQIRSAWSDAFEARWPVTVIGPGGTKYVGTIQSPTPYESTVSKKHPPGNHIVSTIALALLEAKLA